ncbi:hypothetical protein [Saccharothrix variisporea]|uniref:Uncharacterized protein n=1 Tax=Saccharothrix variisporea TaxID=543527 RepID=A0A495X9W0_9PSEU|nr:hypothetical protein [Saccharothrix variisporea]RKT71271.1 hypothetical protein DFJ66_4553 [Saccharothrix variisporea]
MDRDELEMVAGAGRALDECKRFIARVMDESTGMSTTEYTEPVEAWAGRLAQLLFAIGRQAAEWAEARGFVVIDLPPDDKGVG